MTSVETPSLPPMPTPHRAARRAVGEALDENFELDAGFVDEVAAGLRANDKDHVRTLVRDLHYADMADVLERLDSEDRRLLVDAIRDEFNADVLPELAAEVRDEVMDALGFEDIAVALTELDSDDAVYVAGKLDIDERNQVLARVPGDTRALIENGLAYAEHSAGRLMQRELVAVPNYWTVGETIDYLRSARHSPEKFYVIFVVDPRHRPQGVVELHRILKSRRPERMSDLVDPEDDVIPAEMDREEVAFLFRQRDLTAAPVVDKSGRLVGQITIDDVVDVIDEEASEDILKMAGVRATEDSSTLYKTVISTAQSRFIWLVVNLGTAFLASSVIGIFEGSIEKLSALAVLMPICASMGGNAGTQTLATVSCVTAPSAVTGVPRLPNATGTVLKISVKVSASSAGKPSPMRSADVIATGAPNPATPSRSALKLKPMTTSTTPRSLGRLATNQARKASKCPEPTAML